MKKTHSKLISKDDTTLSLKHDIVRVTQFSAAAGKNGTVSIKVNVENVSRKKLKNVPWQILDGNKKLFSGTRYDLGPGESFALAFSLDAAKGDHFYYADVDPENTLKEPRRKQFNNLPQGVDIKIR